MANLPNEVNSPAYKNVAWIRQQPALILVRDLAGGTAVLRAKGQTYLPMEAGESAQAYQVRLSRSLLFNTFVKVREGLIGMALKPRRKKPDPGIGTGEGSQPDTSQTAPSDIGLESDVPLILRQQIEDIDLAGNHLDVFAKELFRDVVNDGHVHVLVDMQKPATRSITSLSPTPTALDDRVTGRRPYWTKYRKDDAYNFKSDRVNGETVLTQVTLRETATKSDGDYGEIEIVRYRVLRLRVIAPETEESPAVYGPMDWTLYEEPEKGKDLVLKDGGSTALTRIPLVTIYARRKALMESDPPLLDLAYLNIGHWQQWSDLNCIQRMLVPILHIKGEILNNTEATAEGAQKPKMGLGPGALINTDKDGDVKYEAADPSATDAMRQALTDLEQRMSAVGLSIISQKQDAKAQVTATEKTMDQDERMSELSSWLRALKDGIEMLFKIHAVDYLGLPQGGSVLLAFDEAGADPDAVTAINAPKGEGMPGQMAGVVNGGVQ